MRHTGITGKSRFINREELLPDISSLFELYMPSALFTAFIKAAMFLTPCCLPLSESELTETEIETDRAD